MENSHDYELTRDEQVALCAQLLRHLYDLCEFGDPASQGECMDCDADSYALWIVGDFLVCHRCASRRLRVRQRMARDAL